MICPKCKGLPNDADDSAEPKRTTVNLGGKQTFKDFCVRRYVCTNCGFSFKTTEEFWTEFELQSEYV